MACLPLPSPSGKGATMKYVCAQVTFSSLIKVLSNQKLYIYIHMRLCLFAPVIVYTVVSEHGLWENEEVGVPGIHPPPVSAPPPCLGRVASDGLT